MRSWPAAMGSEVLISGGYHEWRYESPLAQQGSLNLPVPERDMIGRRVYVVGKYYAIAAL